MIYVSNTRYKRRETEKLTIVDREFDNLGCLPAECILDSAFVFSAVNWELSMTLTVLIDFWLDNSTFLTLNFNDKGIYKPTSSGGMSMAHLVSLYELHSKHLIASPVMIWKDLDLVYNFIRIELWLIIWNALKWLYSRRIFDYIVNN